MDRQKIEARVRGFVVNKLMEEFEADLALEVRAAIPEYRVEFAAAELSGWSDFSHYVDVVTANLMKNYTEI